MTDNYSNSSKGSSFSEPSPLKLVTLTGLVMLICIACSSIYIYLLSQNQAMLHTQNQVNMVKNQAQMTLEPLILTKDTLSMNIYLGTLSQAPFMNGLTLVNSKDQLLAKAGTNNGDLKKTQIFSQQLSIGELTFFINKQPADTFFKKLLWVFVSLAMLSAIFTLLAIAYFSRKILHEFSLQYKPLLEYRFSMELEQANTPPPMQQEAPHCLNKQQNATSLAIVELEIARDTDKSESTKQNDSSKQETALAQPKENKELVSLLKPDTQQRMPHFKPFNDQPDGQVATTQKKRTKFADGPSIQLIEEDLTTAATITTKQIKNPLLHPHTHEEQLDLYSLEHQTELNLKAQEAAYILFIDCSSGRASIEDAQGHQQLLAQYRKLIKLVVNIYGGALELLANGDIRVLFDDKDLHDNHGIQALCAAKLFNQLYKYYNHRQITRMQPTLNIQISLVRGNREKLEILREECHFLTRTTLTNELISHTPLSEAKTLKDSLLDGATTERQEEDKILILELSPTYQELLEKQARHLVKSV